MKNPALLLLATISLGYPASVFAQESSEGRKLYATYCSGCHGTSGRGDGPAAKTLPVQPADHTRRAMNKLGDLYLAEIISKGGASVGKSAQMPAWGAVLKQNQIKDVIAFIRTLAADEDFASGRQGVETRPASKGKKK